MRCQPSVHWVLGTFLRVEAVGSSMMLSTQPQFNAEFYSRGVRECCTSTSLVCIGGMCRNNFTIFMLGILMVMWRFIFIPSVVLLRLVLKKVAVGWVFL